MRVIARRTEYVLQHPVYGFLTKEEWGGNVYTRGCPELRFLARETALRHAVRELTVVAVIVEIYACSHDRRMAYTIPRGKNKGKWIAVCADCGARSAGRPKSTEAIAHASLMRRPCEGEARIVSVVGNG